jgi:hypothetical protein
MEYQSMNLNIWYYLPKDVWDKMPKIYEQLDGWLGYGGGNEQEMPFWFSFDESGNQKSISASVEPSGLNFSGYMDEEEWDIWVKKIKEIATQVLGFKVGEVELGEVDYDKCLLLLM